MAILKQQLGAPQPKANLPGLRSVARSLRAIQLDPINAVERTQLLVLWSRVGPFDRKLFDRLLWKDKFLFHYWAHAASLVLTEDLPIHRPRMRRAFDPSTRQGRRIVAWMEDNRALGSHILRELKSSGPLRARDFDNRTEVPWTSDGWNAGRDVGRMLEILWGMGKVTVAGRRGLERLWDLTAQWLPEDAPRRSLGPRRMVEVAAQHSLRALGVATEGHIKEHFIRGDYAGLRSVLESLERRGVIHPSVIVRAGGEPLPGRWYVHDDDLGLLGRLGPGSTPRTTLLSPFDNLICDRKRTEQLFDLRYRIEIYVPKAKRRFGYYAMPILHRDRLVGVVDCKSDRTRGILSVHAIHFQDLVRPQREIAGAVTQALRELALFTVDGDIDLSLGGIPPAWRLLFKGEL